VVNSRTPAIIRAPWRARRRPFRRISDECSNQTAWSKANPHSLDPVVLETFRLWRKNHLGYDQTKYVVERIRRRLGLKPPRTRNRTVARLEPSEVQRPIQTTYRSQSKYGLMIKTLFQSGARVAEFVHIRVEDLLLDGDPLELTRTIIVGHRKRHHLRRIGRYQQGSGNRRPIRRTPRG
jgi:integrase